MDRIYHKENPNIARLKLANGKYTTSFYCLNCMNRLYDNEIYCNKCNNKVIKRER